MKIVLQCVAIYALFAVIVISMHYVLSDFTYSRISCGEALFRHTGSAAPRNDKEVKMWNECVYFDVKRWPKDVN